MARRVETVIGMTSDMAKVKSAVEAMEFKKGFTNMAQAFTLAENLLLLEGRKEAQSAVMTLTDGKPSFLPQTCATAMRLEDRHFKPFFSPAPEVAGGGLQFCPGTGVVKINRTLLKMQIVC